MYPVFRLFWHSFKYRNAPLLPIGGVHRCIVYCRPWDIDLWRELNNGRTLTLYDLGRVVLMQRLGLWRTTRKHGWGAAVAGVSVRYRKRVKLFERCEMRSRFIGWDKRFFYVEQTLWKSDGDCANQALIRIAVTSAEGMVAPDVVSRALGFPPNSPPLAPWVQAWIDADAQRVWPPEL